MSKGSTPRPTHLPTFRENHDRIFGGAHRTDPIHAMTPGTIREYRSHCCGAEFQARQGWWCRTCLKECEPVLTKVNA